MITRLGNGIYWGCCALAALMLLMSAPMLISELNTYRQYGISLNGEAAANSLVAVAALWAIGRFLRYVLAGR